MSGVGLLTTRQYNLERDIVKMKRINNVEKALLSFNDDLLVGTGATSDEVYNAVQDYLYLIHPESPILKENDKTIITVTTLSEDALDSIETSVEEVQNLKFLLNVQGIGLCLRYKFGELVEAHTVGRSVGGLDVLDKAILLFGDRNENLDGFEDVSVEGVLTIPYSHLDYFKDLCNIQDIYRGLFYIFSILEELDEDVFDMLHFICTDLVCEENIYISLGDRFAFIEEFGFMVPEYVEIPNNRDIKSAIEDAVYELETEFSDYDYKTDGVRLVANQDFYYILRLGKWKPTLCKGVVHEIKWEVKENVSVPVLYFDSEIQVEPGVVVNNIVLDNASLLIIMGIEVYATVYFKSLGTLGEVLTTHSGEIIITR